MMAIAILNRKVLKYQCKAGLIVTWLTGDISWTIACYAWKVAFAVAIAGVFMFIITLVCQVLIRLRSKRSNTKSESAAV